nr:hypothetical protein [Dendronalium sp. ChiSLP03b]
MTAQKLKKLETWLEAQREKKKLREKRIDDIKQVLLWLGGWIGSGWKGTVFYLICTIAAGVCGVTLGINTPTNIPCPNKKSLCYQLRLNKSQVLLPEEIDQVLQKYGLPEKKNQSKSKSLNKKLK